MPQRTLPSLKGRSGRRGGRPRPQPRAAAAPPARPRPAAAGRARRCRLQRSDPGASAETFSGFQVRRSGPPGRPQPLEAAAPPARPRPRAAGSLSLCTPPRGRPGRSALDVTYFSNSGAQASGSRHRAQHPHRIRLRSFLLPVRCRISSEVEGTSVVPPRGSDSGEKPEPGWTAGASEDHGGCGSGSCRKKGGGAPSSPHPRARGEAGETSRPAPGWPAAHRGSAGSGSPRPPGAGRWAGRTGRGC